MLKVAALEVPLTTAVPVAPAPVATTLQLYVVAPVVSVVHVAVAEIGVLLTVMSFGYTLQKVVLKVLVPDKAVPLLVVINALTIYNWFSAKVVGIAVNVPTEVEALAILVLVAKVGMAVPVL